MIQSMKQFLELEQKVLCLIFASFKTEFVLGFRERSVIKCIMAFVWLDIKITVFVLMHLFYLLAHNRFSPAVTLFILVICFGFYERENPLVLVAYISLLIELTVLSLVFKCSKSAQNWLYENFTYQLPTILTGNSSFSVKSLGRVWTTVVAYGAVRTAEQIVYYGMERDGFKNVCEEMRKDNPTPVPLTNEQIDQAHRISREMAGKRAIPQLESGTVSIIKNMGRAVSGDN